MKMLVRTDAFSTFFYLSNILIKFKKTEFDYENLTKIQKLFLNSQNFFEFLCKSSFFVQKFNFDFPRKLSIFLRKKTRENVVVSEFLAVDNFDFTRKIVKKIG